MKKWTSLGLSLAVEERRQGDARRAPSSSRRPGYSHVWQGGPKFNDVITVANNELSAVAEGKESVNDMLSKIKAAAKKAGQ